MLKWSLKKLPLTLDFTWKISRNSSDMKQNFIVELAQDQLIGRAEIAPNVRYGETPDLIEQQFKNFMAKAPGDVASVENLMEVTKELELPAALCFGLEAAYFDLISKLAGKDIHEILGVNTRRKAPTSFSLPILASEEIPGFIESRSLQRFPALKIKIDATNGLDAVRAVRTVYKGPLRIDANEAFQSVAAVMEFCEALKSFVPIDFIEQPLPASMHDDYVELKKVIPFMLIADESVLSQDITSYYVERFHGINVKLMKSGGYLKAIKQLRRAKQLGLKTMLGCMIESSMGISSAMHISHGVDYLDLDGFLLLKSDPFGLLEEEGGVVKYADLQ